MTRHTDKGPAFSLWQDDGFGVLRRIGFDQIITRIKSGWGLI
jgi:hypothetical protein